MTSSAASQVLSRTIWWNRRRPHFAAVAVLAGLGLGLTACGSSATSTTSTATTAAAAGSTTTSSSPTTSSQPATGNASLTKIGHELAAGQDQSYVADYKVSSTENGTSVTGTFTVAHAGSETLFAASTPQGSFEEIINKSKTTICARETGKWMCFSGSLGATIEKDVKPFIDNFSQKSELAKLKALGSGASGATTSTKTFAGQTVTCLTFHASAPKGVYTVCVTSQGVMAEAGGQNSTGHYSLTLSNFTASVPSNEFNPPAKATASP